MKPLKYKQAAAIVRAQIADGLLPPGAPAPSGTALSRITGYSPLTCRRALRALIADGSLVHGASSNARPRVPGPGDKALTDAKRDLSRALARYRHAAGLTQPQLARLIGLSVTTIGHAETGRTWQARQFWEHADKLLNAGGELLRMHDAFRAAQIPPGQPIPPQEPAETEEEVTRPMDSSPATTDPLALSSTLMTEERAYMARWLALEVLMTDETVCEDGELYDRLSVLQEKWQQETLARHGITPAS